MKARGQGAHIVEHDTSYIHFFLYDGGAFVIIISVDGRNGELVEVACLHMFAQLSATFLCSSRVFFDPQTTQKQVRNFLRDRSSRMILWGFSYNFESFLKHLGSSKFNAMSPFSHPRGYPNCTLNHGYPLAESGYQKSRTFTFWAPTLNPHVA